MGIAKLLRFPDLREVNVVKNRVDLGRKIKFEGFPPGRLLGPNTRAWTETEIQEWLDTRPVERAPDAIPREQRFGVNNKAKAAAAKSAKAKTKRSPKRGAR
jgi:predicted DNA-binding transcriptional regulator AlpA